jgi:tetratricopeptide (TPR) repeat protein
MTAPKETTHSAARPLVERQTLALSALILLGFGCVVGLSRWIEAHRPPVDARYEEERLYLTGTTLKRISLGFNGLVADWYWMRSLQYVGRKIINYQGEIQIDDLSPLNPHLLAPLLDTVTTLDPAYMAAYEYGAIVLPAINDQDAIKLLEKGIKANPSAWRLYHHLGYIYWQRDDYKTASAVYGEGAKLPGAPAWMQAMSARMAAEGGSRNTAREMYTRMREQADDPQVKRMAELRLLQIDSFDERDIIRRVLADHRARAGRCASSWKEVAGALRAARLPTDASGAPLDPSNAPYVLVKDGCDVDLDWRVSKIPYK